MPLANAAVVVMEAEIAESDIESLLTEVFALYAASGHLGLSKFRELVRDSGLMGGTLTSRAVDLVFCSAAHGLMQLPAFADCLPRLAAAKWPAVKPREAVIRLIHDHFLPLVLRTQHTPEDDDAQAVLQANFEVLRSIYRTYFHWELSSADPQQIAVESEGAFFSVLRDFELMPQLISRVEAAALWRDMLRSKEQLSHLSVLPSPEEEEGSVFTLSLFATSVYLLSESVPRLSRPQKVLEVLERMQSARPPAPTEESAGVVAESVLPVFQRYCSFGDPMNTTQLGSSQFARLFRECELSVNQRDLDLIYSKLCPKRGKMDFPTFLKALRLVVSKAFPQQPQDSAFSVLIEHYLLRVDTQLPEAKHITRLGNLLQDPDIVGILSLIHGAMLYYYHYYADSRGLLAYTGFIRFCTDFSLFPDICAKSKLLALFNALASVFSSTGQPEASLSKTRTMYLTSPLSPEGPVIDEHLFLEGLALISQELELSTDPSPPRRLCLLVEKVVHSGGPEKVMRALGHSRREDVLGKLKSQYGHLLQHSERKPTSLWELLSSRPA